MNIYEDAEPKVAELISVVAHQPARQPAVDDAGRSQRQEVRNFAQTRQFGDLNSAPNEYKNWSDSDVDDDVPLLVPGVAGNETDALVLGRGPFWAGRVWGRSRKAWWGGVFQKIGLSLGFIIIGFSLLSWISAGLLNGFSKDNDWTFGVGCSKKYPVNRTNDDGFNVDDDDSNGVIRQNCRATELFGIVASALIALLFMATLYATVRGWQKSGPRNGSTVLDLNDLNDNHADQPHTSRHNQSGRRECRECASYWCCETVPGLVCDWICTTACGGGGVLPMVCSICLPGPAAWCDALKEGKCLKGICTRFSNNASRRPRGDHCLDTPFACGSGHCCLPSGFCPCLHTRRMLWWAASEYPDEEAARTAAKVLAGSSRESVVEYAPTASCTSRCVAGIIPLNNIIHRADENNKPWVDYRSPLALACELNKPKLAEVLLKARATVWNRAGYALPEEVQRSSSSNSPAHIVAATGNLDMFALLDRYTNENNDLYAYVCISSDDAAGVPCQKQPKWGTKYEIHGTRIKVLAHGTPVEKHAAALSTIAKTTSSSNGTTWVMFKNAPGPGWYPLRGEEGGKQFFEAVHWLDAQNSNGETPIDVARDHDHEQLALWMEHARTDSVADAFVKSASTLLDVQGRDYGDAASATTPSISSILALHGKHFSTLAANTEAFKLHRQEWTDDRLLTFAADRALDFIGAMETNETLGFSTAVAIHLRASVADYISSMPSGNGLQQFTSLATLLLPIKTFLEAYVQHPLQFGSTTFENLPAAFQTVLVEPAEQIIRGQAFQMMEQVRQNVDGALLQIAGLAEPDSRIYTAQLRKALRGGGQLQFDTMVDNVNRLYDLLANAPLAVQPCTSPVELTIRATEAMPGFQTAVDNMIALLKSRGHVKIAATHRPVSKSTYRIIEKCLLKIAGQDILEMPIDASKILDVAGCLIACGSFEDVLAVMEMIYSIGDGGEGKANTVVELPVQTPRGKQSKLWRGVSIKTEVVKKGVEQITGSGAIEVVRGVPLMMRILPSPNAAGHRVRAQCTLDSKILENLEGHDVVEVLERSETMENGFYLTRVRITCARTGVAGWMSQKFDRQDGKGWTNYMEPVELPPAPLAPTESYRHTVTSIGPGNTANTTSGSPLQLFVGDEIVSINGAATATMTPVEVSNLLNNYEEASQPQQLEVRPHGWDVCRMKDSWTGLSKAGWRDYKVNLVFSGIVFEIQVVLEGMMTARTKLDGHLAYNEFRFLYECVAYLGPDYKSRLEEASESKMLESERIGRSESAADQLEDAELENEVLREDLKMRNAEIAKLRTTIEKLQEEQQ